MSRANQEEVLHLIRAERAYQLQQFGPNEDVPLGFGGTVSAYPWLHPFSLYDAGGVQCRFRQDYEQYVQAHGKPTWMHLIREEVAELFEASHREDMIAEAVQVAALCVSLVEKLLEIPGGTKLTAEMYPVPVFISDVNRRIIEQAYDDQNGNTITLVPTNDSPWFVGMYEDNEVCQGMEHNGVLYTIVHASGGGLVSVLVGRALLENKMGVVFHSVNEAKAYVQGCIAR